MRLLLDVTPWADIGRGITVYILKLLEEFPALFAQNDEICLGVRFHSWRRNRCRRDLFDAFPKLRLWPLPWQPGIRRFDLHHVTYPGPPYAPSRPAIVTFHDLYPFVIDPLFHLYTARVRRMYLKRRRKFRSAALRADAVICDSHNTRADIARFIPEAAHKAHVIPLAADPLPQVNALPPAAKGLAGKRYLLHLGSFSVIRNIPRTVQAFSRLNAPDTLLVLVGNAEEDTARTADTINNLGLNNRVVILHHVDETTKAALLRNAAGLVMFHHYAGFGIPLLEAMQAGIPVAASPAGSLREVAAHAALYAHPGDVEAMTHAMDSLLQDDLLRRRLVEAGRERLKLFSWSRTARMTWDLYRSLLA